MISTLKTAVVAKIKSSFGWKTNRKIVTFESDDWGSIRMPSQKVYDTLTAKGIKLDSAGGGLFNKYDNLANEDDLHALFEVLHSVKDSHGNPAVFTAVSVVANPDFDKIREHNYEQYFYEPFTKTLERQQGHNRTFKLWQEGIHNKVFIPQSHSREHLNTLVWMDALKAGDEETRTAFDHGIWGFDRKGALPSYQVAFSMRNEADIPLQENIIKEGLALFENLFGYKAQFFVPPNGIMHPTLERCTFDAGISLLFGSFIFQTARAEFKSNTTVRYLGQTNSLGQRYILRNCLFEPNQPGLDWVGIALKDIESAFSYKQPAILGPHRKNFIGSIDERNRTNGLQILRSLLKEILKKWPDVEFMSTDQLGKIINTKA